MKVVSKASDWAGFVRRAKRHHPKEHVEAIWGLETIDSFRITKFVRIKIESSNQSSISYHDVEIKRQKWLAEKEGLRFLGTVHTHPHKDHDSSASDYDHEDAIKKGEKVMGVIHLWKNTKDRFEQEVRWWFPQQPLTFELTDE